MEENKAEANIIFTDGWFEHLPMGHIREVIFCIYDNPTFEYASGKVIYIPD
jgi:hypothetical protein